MEDPSSLWLFHRFLIISFEEDQASERYSGDILGPGADWLEGGEDVADVFYQVVFCHRAIVPVLEVLLVLLNEAVDLLIGQDVDEDGLVAKSGLQQLSHELGAGCSGVPALGSFSGFDKPEEPHDCPMMVVLYLVCDYSGFTYLKMPSLQEMSTVKSSMRDHWLHLSGYSLVVTSR